MDKRKKHGWPFWFATGILLLPVLYIGSFGPAAWIASRTSDPITETILGYYAPLAFVGAKVTPLGSFLDWYANLFFSDAPVPAATP